MFCQHCGAKIDEGAKFCISCGESLQPTQSKAGDSMQQQDKQSPPSSFIVTPEIKKKAKKSRRIGCLIFLIIVLTISIAAGFGISSLIKNQEQNAGIKIEDLPSGITMSDFLLIKNALNASTDVVLKNIGIFEDCELGTIKEITSDPLLDGMDFDGERGYRLTSSVKNIILYTNEDGSVFSLRYADNVLYADEEVKSKLSDYIVSWDEQNHYEVFCETFLKTNILKSPSSAKFPSISEWKFGKQDNNFIVQGYVDSQNSFGAVIRSNFQFKFLINTDTVVSLIFDGEELIQN